MAKKSAKSGGESEVNKSKAIREYLVAHPDEGPTEVATALNEREGWEISPAYVSTIKNKMKQLSEGTGRGTAGKPSGLLEESLMQAKELARQAGGIPQAKAALDFLAKLTG